MILSGGRAVDLAPQALAETTPLLHNGWYYPRTGLDLAQRRATYGEIYRTQPSIHTLAGKVGDAEARLTLNVWNMTPAGKELADPETDAYARLIASPCPDMDPFAFYRWTRLTQEIYGEAYWLKVRDDDGSVVALMPMHPTSTIVQRDPTGRMIYTFSIGIADAGLLTVDETEVVPFRRYNPDDRMRGLSRLEPLRSTLLAEDASRRATASMWTRGARPSFHLSAPASLSKGAQERLKAQLANHTGPDRAGQVLVLEEGLKPEVVQIDLEKMMYVEGRKLDMQEACMVYDVPPPVVHILDNATFSNITEQMRSQYRDTMAPRLEEDESVIAHYLGSEFPGRHRARFALDEVLRGDFETRATAVTALISNGVMKPSEARPLFDLDDAGAVADRLYGNAALVPLGSNPTKPPATGPNGEPVHPALPARPPTPPAPAEDDPSPAKAGRVDARALAGRLGRFKAMPRELRTQLSRETSAAMRDVFRRQSVAAQIAMQTKAAGDLLDADAWDAELEATLLTLSKATVRRIGDQVAAKLEAGWDPTQLDDWLTSEAGESATNINATTAAGLAAAVRDLPEGRDAHQALVEYFDDLDANRAEEIGDSRVTYLAGATSQNAARQSGARTKTWVVNAANPRPTHEVLGGETVGLDELFSNGMNGPGDPAGGADEVAGCTCDLDFSTDAPEGADDAGDAGEGTDAA